MLFHKLVYLRLLLHNNENQHEIGQVNKEDEEDEAGDDLGTQGGILQTAVQKYVDKKDSDKERKKKAA